MAVMSLINPLNAELNSICHLLILLGDLTIICREYWTHVAVMLLISMLLKVKASDSYVAAKYASKM
jgi:hypothetical protein